MTVKNLNIKLFQKKTTEGVEDTYFGHPWNFQDFYSTPTNSIQSKASPLETPQNC